jgi:hypothetical protein
MTGTQTLHRIRATQSGQVAPVSQRNSFASAFVAGLTMFGLASNGTCLAALDAAGSDAEDQDCGGDASGASSGTVTHNLHASGVPRCRR